MNLQPSSILILLLAAAVLTAANAQIAPRGIAVLSSLVQHETSAEVEEEVDSVIAYYEGSSGCVFVFVLLIFDFVYAFVS